MKNSIKLTEKDERKTEKNRQKNTHVSFDWLNMHSNQIQRTFFISFNLICFKIAKNHYFFNIRKSDMTIDKP